MEYRRVYERAALVLAILVGVFVGASGFTFAYARGASYLFNDPETCQNCHIMRAEFDGWTKSSHHAVAVCNDCHVSQGLISKWLTKAENGFNHSAAFTFQNFHEPIQLRPHSSRVLEQNCLRCHQELVNTIRAYHGGASGDISCVRCHASVGHGPAR